MKKIKLILMLVALVGFSITGSVFAADYPKELHGKWVEAVNTSPCKDRINASVMDINSKTLTHDGYISECKLLSVKGYGEKFTLIEKCWSEGDVSGDAPKHKNQYTVAGNFLTVDDGRGHKKKYKKCSAK